MSKIVFLTGGTGSFGQGFADLLLNDPEIRMIRIFSRDEHKQHKMRKDLNSDRVSFFIGDVRDKERVIDAMDGSDWIVHAAALKQAPLGEIEPQEFIKTNVIGSMNVIDAARYVSAEKVVLISTDKAVEPVNLYGATKMCAERMFLQANGKGAGRTRFAVVRYGNVAGTNGSIVPLFLSLKEFEPTPITDPMATRFWINLKDANQFVLDSIRHMYGGELFVPTLKSVRVADIAEAIRPGKPIVIMGNRPGEKRHEVLKVEYDGFRYCSEDNEFMSVEEIRDNVFGKDRLMV